MVSRRRRNLTDSSADTISAFFFLHAGGDAEKVACLQQVKSITHCAAHGRKGRWFAQVTPLCEGKANSVRVDDTGHILLCTRRGIHRGQRSARLFISIVVIPFSERPKTFLGQRIPLCRRRIVVCPPPPPGRKVRTNFGRTNWIGPPKVLSAFLSRY